MKGIGEMTVIAAVVHFLCCIVGVQGQIGVSICSYGYKYICPRSLPNSYCNFATFLCECENAAGYFENAVGSRCYYKCGAPTAPENGSVDTPQGTATGDVAIYSCNNGYKVEGNSTATCVQDVGWDNTAATCVQGEIGDDCTSDATLCGNIAFGYCQGTCKCSPGYEDDGTSQNCQDINECENATCQNGATCVDEINRYTCICSPGYDGTYCNNDIDECGSNPCQNGATCNDLINSYSCTCVYGYSGEHCQTNIDECVSNACQNGATCNDLINSYSCTCVNGYTGDHCQTNIDECGSNPCQNGATCNDLVNNYSCTCVYGYSGEHCQTNCAMVVASETEIGIQKPAPYSIRSVSSLTACENLCLSDEKCKEASFLSGSNLFCALYDTSLHDQVPDDKMNEEDKHLQKVCYKGNCDRSREFQCGDGTCIDKTKRCNNIPECSDRLDELLCDSETRIAGTDAGTISCLVTGKWEEVYCSAKDQNDAGDSSTIPVIILACSLTAAVSIALTSVVLFVFRKYKRIKLITPTSNPESAVYFNNAVRENLEGTGADNHQYEHLNVTTEKETE